MQELATDIVWQNRSVSRRLHYRPVIRMSVIVLLALPVTVLSFGCVTGDKGSQSGLRLLKPNDVSADSTPIQPRSSLSDRAERDTSHMAVAQPTKAIASDRSDSPPLIGPASGQAIDVDAMVGQVHGRPIYASKVFEELDAELSALGQKLPREVFRRQIVNPGPDGTRLIPDRLEGIVINALILGDAERDLSEQHQMVVRNNLKEWREEILRQAMGSVARADKDLQESTGIGLEGTMEEIRKGMVVKMYMQHKLANRITVTRRDIQNYYDRHEEQFNQPSGRLVRMISTVKFQNVDQIDDLLKKGTPFAEVAASPLNQYKRTQNGLFAERAEGDQIFEDKVINDTALNLKEGQYAPRVAYDGKFVWVFVEKIYPVSNQSFSDVQSEIDRTLRTRQYARIFNKYRSKLLREGSYTSITQMTDILVNIASDRYVIP